MTDNTGGPAFPAPAGVTHITTQGMTLRDYFAAKALQAGIGLIPNMNSPKGQTVPEALTEMAYEFADAMLRAREDA